MSVGPDGAEYGELARTTNNPLTKSLTRILPLGKKGYVYKEERIGQREKSSPRNDQIAVLTFHAPIIFPLID